MENYSDKYPFWAIKVIAQRNNKTSWEIVEHLEDETSWAKQIYIPQLNTLMNDVYLWLKEIDNE